jgi:Zn finger protein HypA/HybF involved in hydrogenase expression
MTHVCETCKTTYEAQAVSKFCPVCEGHHRDYICNDEE